MADYTVFGSTPGPSTSGGDGTPVNLSHQVNITSAPVWALGIRFYRGTTDITGTPTGRLWLTTGPGAGTTVPGSDVAFSLSGTGWQVALFDTPILIGDPGSYNPTVHFGDQFTATANYWQPGNPGAGGITSGPLTAPDHAAAINGQGSFSTGAISTYPATGTGNGYWVDLLVTDTDPEGGAEVADHTVAADEQGVHAVQLTANVVETVTFADDVSEVEIVNMTGTAPVYFTVDGTTPTVAGKTTRLIPAAITSVEIEPPGSGPTTVKLISAGTPTISVARSS